MDSTFLKNFLVNIMIILGVWASQAMSYTVHEATVFEKHEQWMARYGRVYSNKTEKERRFRIFKENVEYINKFNSAGNHTYKLGINEFADLTSQEFLASHTGYNSMSTQPSSSGTSFRYKNVSAVPPNMDWRERGAVIPVKNQDKCGCCWAFSAVAAMEGLTKIRTGQLISLSEQEILDCDGAANGCGSGYMTKAFEFAISKGVTTEANYPYTAVEGTCNTEKAASPTIMESRK